MEKLQAPEVSDALTEYFGGHKNKIAILGVFCFGISIVFQVFLEPNWILTLDRLGGFLLLIATLIRKKAEKTLTENLKMNPRLELLHKGADGKVKEERKMEG